MSLTFRRDTPSSGPAKTHSPPFLQLAQIGQLFLHCPDHTGGAMQADEYRDAELNRMCLLPCLWKKESFGKGWDTGRVAAFPTPTFGIQYGNNSLTDYLGLNRFGTINTFWIPGEKEVGDGEDLQGLSRSPAPQNCWARREGWDRAETPPYEKECNFGVLNLDIEVGLCTDSWVVQDRVSKGFSKFRPGILAYPIC